MSQHESIQQRALIQWANLQRIGIGDYKITDFLYAIPNGGKRSKVTAHFMRLEGVKAGVHDLHLPIPKNGHIGLWIEMKWGKNTMTKEQLEWKEKMQLVGHKCVTCYTWMEAKEAIIDYLGV